MNNNFTLYGVMDMDTNKLVSNITNPRHKYWETRKRAESAVNKYNSYYRITKRNLKVVEIDCVVKEPSEF